MIRSLVTPGVFVPRGIFSYVKSKKPGRNFSSWLLHVKKFLLSSSSTFAKRKGKNGLFIS
jgi:hypothetical protein